MEGSFEWQVMKRDPKMMMECIPWLLRSNWC